MDLQQHYSAEAFDANVVGLAVPVALELKQLILLREIAASLATLNANLEKLVALTAQPPSMPPTPKTSVLSTPATPTKKAP